ncbi:HET-domain-containing protein [Hyaloscypha variabilis F]|uniref:HET-domain-containing protein n=1 Tax=Hyaloscypha variabilis (strain UAMH 11265 / GT02V1 / F) TaxID=1149755 RepID=A0A2J6RDY9_HYAVF|nr:HET-domain-containing protein [Hyaloscypha variabilis F]
MRINTTRKWVDEQAKGSRPPASNHNGGGKRRKIEVKRQQDVLAHPAKVVNMSIVHGLRDLAIPLDGSAFAFPYKPLDSSKSEIRVINLKHGVAPSPVECTLQHIPMASKSRGFYRALSYTWGPSEPTKVLLLDHIQIEVRENLWQALYHLRQPDADLSLWVDALCINQEDIPERNEQVSRMGTLYNQAEEVIVWLGPRKDDSDTAVSAIKRSVVPSSRLVSVNVPSSSGSFSSIEIHSIHNLLHREYWTRVWIIQEVFKARKIMIHCGHENLPWKDLAKFLRQAKKMSDDYLDPFFEHIPRSEVTGIFHSPATPLTDHRTTRIRDLETLLMTYDGSFCCDPRDKVYALTGIAGRRLTDRSKKLVGQDWLTIDYSRTPHELFQVLTLMYAAEVGDGYLVRWMQMLQQILKLPAPWTTSPTPLPQGSAGEVACKTCLHARVSSIGPAITWYPYAKRLSIRNPSQYPSRSPDYTALFEWYSQFLGPRMPSSGRVKKALLDLTEEDMARLESFKHADWLTKFVPSGQAVSSVDAASSRANSPKIRPFTLHTGRLGFTSCEITESDEIVRFHGSDVALVVPRVQRMTLESPDIQAKGRALILKSDNTENPPGFLSSFNSKFEWAVPSWLDDLSYHYNIEDDSFDPQYPEIGLWGLDKAPPDDSYQKEVERFDGLRSGLNGTGSWRYWRKTLKEWEFWTW